MIKGFEKCQHHNSLPGAIRRDVPYYRELAEVYGVYGRWPHIQTSRTMEMRTKRKYRLRLRKIYFTVCYLLTTGMQKYFPYAFPLHTLLFVGEVKTERKGYSRKSSTKE